MKNARMVYFVGKGVEWAAVEIEQPLAYATCKILNCALNCGGKHTGDGKNG